MNLDWLDAFLLFGTFQVVMVIGLALLLHLQLGLARIANFGVVGFWALGAYAFGVLFTKVDWSIGDPWPFLISMVFGTVGPQRERLNRFGLYRRRGSMPSLKSCRPRSPR